jgi:hypothetical protein
MGNADRFRLNGWEYGDRAARLMALEPKLKRGIGVDFQIAPESTGIISEPSHILD